MGALEHSSQLGWSQVLHVTPNGNPCRSATQHSCRTHHPSIRKLLHACSNPGCICGVFDRHPPGKTVEAYATCSASLPQFRWSSPRLILLRAFYDVTGTYAHPIELVAGWIAVISVGCALTTSNGWLALILIMVGFIALSFAEVFAAPAGVGPTIMILLFLSSTGLSLRAGARTVSTRVFTAAFSVFDVFSVLTALGIDLTEREAKQPEGAIISFACWVAIVARWLAVVVFALNAQGSSPYKLVSSKDPMTDYARVIILWSSHWLCHWLLYTAWSDLDVHSFGLHYVVWRCFTTSCWRTFEWTLRSPLFVCMLLFLVRFTQFHQGLGWLSCLRSPTFRHCDDPRDLCFTGHFGQWCCYFMIPFVIGASFLRSNAPLVVTGISNPMASLRRSSFPLCTIDDVTPEWLSRLCDALFLGGLICFRICLFNSFIVLANDFGSFCCFHECGIVRFRAVVADWRANRPGHVP